MASFSYWRTKRYLDSVGKGYCLEKWHSNTVHLGTGTEHGCHHVAPVKIPLEEIQDNPYALFNHSHKRQVRREMLRGEKPKECAYCWRATKTQDRVLQSSKYYNWENRHKVTSEYSLPKYLEVSLGNTCNLACAYCGPSFSSKWASEIKQHGNLHHKGYAPTITKDNPYKKAFMEIWPNLHPGLEELRFTGGEPLLYPEIFDLIQDVSIDCDVIINTGLGVPKDLLEKFLEKSSHIDTVIFAISGESAGAQAEYTRHGINYNDFLKNVELISKQHNADIELMTVYNALCLESYTDYISDIQNIAKVDIGVSELTTPSFLHHILFDLNKQQHLDFLKKHNSKAHSQLESILTKEQKYDIVVERGNFERFVNAYDQRRNTDFKSAFPILGALL